jgi:hypothetical protein
MRSLRLLGLLPLALPFALAGCLQGAGDRCQVQSDCADGLICVLPPGGTPQSGGTCQPPAGLDASVGDLLPPPDLTVTPDLTSTD